MVSKNAEPKRSGSSISHIDKTEQSKACHVSVLVNKAFRVSETIFRIFLKLFCYLFEVTHLIISAPRFFSTLTKKVKIVRVGEKCFGNRD